MASRIVLNTISYHGHGAIENIVPELTARGYKKAFVCSDPDLIKFGVTKKVTDLLDAAACLQRLQRDQAQPHHPERSGRRCRFKAAEADCIVTIGGGSPWIPPRPSASSSTTPSLRTSAAWRALPHQEARRVHHCGAHHRRTAAEVTINYVITDVEKKRKFVCVDTNDIPRSPLSTPI
uniref:iron-containing alcohol dehydrogenase n=1 Tax=Gemmiger formicilis TaxID=745368 RepID=UPI003FF0680C